MKRVLFAYARHAADDPRVEVRRVGAFFAEPSDVSSTDSESLRTLDGRSGAS
jgi:hypothetical protein